MAVSIIQVPSSDVAYRRSCEFCGITFTRQPAFRVTRADGAVVYIHRHCAAMVLESVFEAQMTRAQRARENMAQIRALGGVASEGHERHIADGRYDPASCHDCAMLQETDHEYHVVHGGYDKACAACNVEEVGPNAEDWSGTR